MKVLVKNRAAIGRNYYKLSVETFFSGNELKVLNHLKEVLEQSPNRQKCAGES